MTDDRDVTVNVNVDDDGDPQGLHHIRRMLRDITNTLEELMAVTDTLVASVATLKSDADAAAARDAANAQAAADAAAAAAANAATLQASIDDLNNQVALLTAEAVDPAVISALEADIAAIDGVVNSIAATP